MENHHFEWENQLFQLFLWQFSIVFCMYLPEGKIFSMRH